MYGNGSYAPQFRQGPPPLYQQPQYPPPPPQPQPAPQYQHPPPAYQHGPPPFMHQPQPSYSYPPRLPPPPPPPVMYRAPHPPPAGMQHVLTPPPPPPPSFASITPSFTPVGAPPLPPQPASPPPMPPSSPPPPPPPPPVDGGAAVDGGESERVATPPPRPEDAVVRTIENLCKYIAEVGPHFEGIVRSKEAGNLEYAFLFGGPEGSAEAIGHEYFQWVKRNYKSVMKSREESEQDDSRSRDKESASQGDDGVAGSPAVSDMDMEDDVGPDGDHEFDHVTEVSTSETISGSNKMGVVEEPLHAVENIDSVVAVSDTIPCSEALLFVPDGKDEKGSSLTEDVNRITALPDSAVDVFQDILDPPAVTSPSDSKIHQGSLTVDGSKSNQISRVFVKDGSPLRLIQGYISDDSDEDDEVKVENIKADRISPKAYSHVEPENASLTKVEGNLPSSDSDVPSLVTKAGLFTDSSVKTSISPIIIHSSQMDPSDDIIGTSEPPQIRNIVNQDKNDNLDGNVKGIGMPDVDEFGRLIRKGSSDSDSDGRHYNERSGKRGRSLSRSRSPREGKWRRRSRSPWKRDKQSHSPRSPGPSRSKSPPASRRTPAFARRDRDQPLECFNFNRGRCFRGASCRYLHNDLGRQRSRQQQCQEYPQDRENYDMHGDVPVYQNPFIGNEKDMKECPDIVQKDDNTTEIQASKDLSELTINTIDDGVLVQKEATGSVLEDVEPPENKDVGEVGFIDQVSKEVISEVQEPEVENVMQTSNLSPKEEEKLLPMPESGQLDIQSSVGKSQALPNEVLVHQTNSTDGTLFQPVQPDPVSTSTPEQPQNVQAEDHMVDPVPVQAVEATPIQNQTLESQPYPSHAPVNAAYPSQSLLPQPHANFAPTYQPSDASALPKEFTPPSLSTPGSNFQPSQMLPPAPNGQPASIYPSREFLPPPAMGHQPQHPLSHAFPSQGPSFTSDYNSLRAPTNTVWPKLPPPPPRPEHASSLPGWPSFRHSDPPASQFQQNALPPRNDFNTAMRPILAGDSHRNQVPDVRHFYPEAQVPLHVDEFKQMPLHGRNQHDQPFERDGRFLHPPMTGLQTVMDTQRDYHLRHQPFLREDHRTPLPAPGSAHTVAMHPQSMPFPREPLPNRPYSFSEDSMPPRILPREQYPNMNDFSRQPSYFSQQPANSNILLNPSTSGTVDATITRYSSSFLESNLAPHPSGLPKNPIPIHYNPYASTFEQTHAIFKFGPNAPGREADSSFNSRYDSSVNSGHVPVGGSGSRITVSPHGHSVSSEQFIARTGDNPPEAPPEVVPIAQKTSVKDMAAGVAYDPLFDSIEPSFNALNKEDHAKENADILNVENIWQKGGTNAEPKSEADELGEVATDAEVGAVENGSPLLVDGKEWSPGVPPELENIAAGEIEIDHVRSPGKRKSKDSRSMKLFKIALADFVKEVLKPSWRQGNMSKEAFKTIVKKTVEKVSGAMSNHQVPKTQVKINQYVESSQRKLTKLVMGYVDKYVKS